MTNTQRRSRRTRTPMPIGPDTSVLARTLFVEDFPKAASTLARETYPLTSRDAPFAPVAQWTRASDF